MSEANSVELSYRNPASILHFFAARRGTRIVIRDSDNPAYDFFKLWCTEASHIGRNGSGGPTWLGIKGNKRVAPLAAGNNLFRIVSFHTDDALYTAAAAKLRASAEALSLPFHIEIVPAGRTWERTCSFKAKFIQDMWRGSDIPIVWLDADATLNRFPALFSVINADFAAYKRRWSIKAGTLYFGKTELADTLLAGWVARCEADPDQWDQISLDLAWAEIASRAPLRTVWLPETYCWKFDKPDKSNDAVILQWQASRNVANDKKTFPSPKSNKTFIRARRASRTS
jgi:hypothetical protein